jgi:hypothetical protein
VKSPSPEDSHRRLAGFEAGPARNHGHLVGDDIRRIETDAELADQVRILGLIAGQRRKELARARLGDRSEVLDRLVARQADAVVGNAERAGFLVEATPGSSARCRHRRGGIVQASKRSLSQASEALEINSRRKISLLLYSEWIIKFSSCLTSA